MENLYRKEPVIDRLRKYASGMQFKEQQLTEEQKLLITLDLLFGSEALNDFIAEYLDGGKPTYPLF